MSNKNKNIKDFLKPRKGRIKQGYFKPKNPEKYKGDPHNIIYRSGWEFKFFSYCDTNPSVIEYVSEKRLTLTAKLIVFVIEVGHRFHEAPLFPRVLI